MVCGRGVVLRAAGVRDSLRVRGWLEGQRLQLALSSVVFGKGGVLVVGSSCLPPLGCGFFYLFL